MDMAEQLERRGGGELKLARGAVGDDFALRRGTHYSALFPPEGPDDSPTCVIIFESKPGMWRTWIVSGETCEFLPPGDDRRVIWELGRRGLESCEAIWTLFSRDCHVGGEPNG